MAFWSFSTRKPRTRGASASGMQEITELTPVLEGDPGCADAANGGYEGLSTVPPDDVARSGAEARHASGLHSKLTLQSSHTIYHVGSRETPDAVLSERTLDDLRDLCLRILGGEERARVISVVSDTDASEAKSHVAAQLATMLSGDYGPSVLAMEANPEAPALHRALGFLPPRGYGLGEQLQRLSDKPTGRISIVQLNPRLAALVATEMFQLTQEWPACYEAVLTQLRREHEYIILDGPVVGSEVDTAHLLADGILFVKAEGTKLTQTLDTVAAYLPSSALIRIVEIESPRAVRNSGSSWRAILRKR